MKIKSLLPLFCLLTALLSACGGNAVWLTHALTLSSTPANSATEDATITALVPRLTGSQDPGVIKFNQEASGLVYAELVQFGSNISMANQYVDPSLGKSSLDVRYALLSPRGNLLSLKFTITTSVRGAAHPFTVSRTLTYDLNKGADVSLEQLFLPGSDYLGAISTYCLAALQASEIGPVLFAGGALPRDYNYQNWNITSSGLLITFDENQVAAYAAGPQLVTVPYAQLADIIDPQGPLARFIP